MLGLMGRNICSNTLLFVASLYTLKLHFSRDFFNEAELL